MIPFPYSPWPFLDFGSDPDPNGTPPAPNVPGVTIPWSALPPVVPPPPALPPVVPPPNIPPPPQPTLPPSGTPGFDKTFASQPTPPPVAQPPRNPSLADIIAPWMQPPEAEPPPPPPLPPSETPGLDKAIARTNAPTPGFHLTPGLGGFSQPPMWSLPPPPQLLPMPPLPMPMGGGLAALGAALPPPMPAPSPLILASNGPAATTMPRPDVGPGISETLKQMGRRLTPYATEMGAAIGRTLPSVGAAGAGALAAAPILLMPSNTQSVGIIDLGDGLRTNLPPGQRYVPIERRVAPGVFGTDVGAVWKQVLGLYGEVDPGRGVLVNPDRLREALGDEAADRVLNTPGIMPMTKPSPDEQPSPSTDDTPDSDGDLETPKDTTPPPPELPKPEGIPDDWIAKPSKKNGGVRYFNPKNEHDQVRVMPGNPKSPNPHQQRPYVIDQNKGSIVDKNGQPIGGAKPEKSPDAHIPLEDFKFRR